MDEIRVSFVDPAKTFILAIFNRGGVIVVVLLSSLIQCLGSVMRWG